MVFNLNNFLLAFSEVLKSKKATYIALNLALNLKLTKEKLCRYLFIYNLAFPFR